MKGVIKMIAFELNFLGYEMDLNFVYKTIDAIKAKYPDAVINVKMGEI